MDDKTSDRIEPADHKERDPSTTASSDLPNAGADAISSEASQRALPSDTPQQWVFFFRGSAASRLIDGEADLDVDAETVQELQKWRLFDCADDLTSEEVSCLLKALDADFQGILASDDGPNGNGEIRGSLYEFMALSQHGEACPSLYEFRAVSLQEATSFPAEFVRLRVAWADLESKFAEMGGVSEDKLACDPARGLLVSSRKFAEQIRSVRRCPKDATCEAATPKDSPNENVGVTPGETYLLFYGFPVLCIDGFSEKESQLLIEVLEEERPSYKGAYVTLRSSECNAKQLIWARRQWHALKPYLGEFDFAVFDPEPPDDIKCYVYINYEVDKIAREIEGMRPAQGPEVAGQKDEEKGEDFFDAIPTVVVGCLALRELDAALRLYPTAVDPGEAKRMYDELVVIVESALDGKGFEKLRAMYRRPALGNADGMFALAALQSAVLMWHPELHGAGLGRLEHRFESAIQKCQQSVPSNLEKILARLLEIELFDCRIPHPAGDPTYQDPKRFCQLLREYWGCIKPILFTASEIPVHGQPHSLTRLILNLQDRLDTCLQRLTEIKDLQSVRRDIDMLVSSLLSGDPGEFGVLLECEPDLIPRVEMAIEETSLALGTSNFELTHAESKFIVVVKKAAEDDRKWLKRQWDRILGSVQQSTSAVTPSDQNKPAAKTAAAMQGADKSKHPWGDDDPETLLSPAKLADRLHIPPEDRKNRENLRGRLRTWRDANPGGGWIEVADRKAKQPGYLYPVGKVWTTIEDMESSG